MADPQGTIFGVDVSHHQETLDVSTLKASGIQFVIARTAQVKGGKYGTTMDRAYAKHKANAAKGGMLFSSYLYLGDGETAARNVAIHAQAEPDRNVPVALDCEEGSGSIAFFRECVAAFQAAGYYVWGSYIPRWYWQGQGSQSLAGLPVLWSSRYADMTPGNLPQEYASTPDSYWANYGNNTVSVLQFTSSGRLAGYSGSLDLNAYRGSLAQLEDLWNPDVDTDPEPVEQRISNVTRISVPANRGPEGGVNPPDSIRIRDLPGGPNAKLIVRPGVIDGNGVSADPIKINYVWAWGSDKAGVGHNPITIPGYNQNVTTDREVPLPGAVWADFAYESNAPFVIDVVG